MLRSTKFICISSDQILIRVTPQTTPHHIRLHHITTLPHLPLLLLISATGRGEGLPLCLLLVHLQPVVKDLRGAGSGLSSLDVEISCQNSRNIPPDNQSIEN